MRNAQGRKGKGSGNWNTYEWKGENKEKGKGIAEQKEKYCLMKAAYTASKTAKTRRKKEENKIIEKNKR